MGVRNYKRYLSMCSSVPAFAAVTLFTTSVFATPDTQTVTDMSGTSVTVPVKAGRIAEQFPAHTVTDIMLGAGDKLVGIPQNVKTIPLLKKIYPRIASVPELFKGSAVNMEELLATNPDVVSAVGGATSVSKLRATGIPAVVMSFDTYEKLQQSVTLAGTVYGDESKQRAAKYNAYLQGKIKLVRSRLADLPQTQRPTVVHIASYPPLVVDGGSSIIDQWIALGGGIDAAASVSGPHVSINMEQLLAWDPDVLIIETPGGDQGLSANSGQSVLAALAQAPGWQQLRAIKAGRVYINPQGMYPWDRYGPEEALQIQWVAKTLHSERFKDLDMRAETRHFYQTFFGYSLSEAELDQVFQTRRK